MPRLLPLALILSAMIATTGAALGADSTFVIGLRGFTVGSFQLSSQSKGNTYAVAADIKDAGLLSVFRSFFYRASARGALKGNRVIPRQYRETADTGRRQSEVVLDYVDGAPRVTSYASTTPPGPDAPDPASQSGTLDPASVLFAVFREMPRAAACNTEIFIYDGMRRSRLALGKPRPEGDGLRCAGEYRRLQGFTPKELSRNVAFPLELTLSPVAGGKVRVTHVEITSSYGLATLDRR